MFYRLPDTMQATMPIRWTSSCEGMRKPESVCAKFISRQNLDIIIHPAFVDQWSKTGKGLLAHKYAIILRSNCFVELRVVAPMRALR